MHRLHQWILKNMNLKSASCEAVEGWQVDQLKKQLRYTRSNSSFYAEALAAIAIDSIKTLDDISQLPFVTSAQIAESGKKMLCVSMSDIDRTW